MTAFRQFLYGCIVAIWTAGGLAVFVYAVYLLPVDLHLFHPATGLAAWVYQHSLSRGCKIGAGLLVVTIFWPVTLVLLEVVVFVGLAMASAVEALFGPKGHRGTEPSGTVSGTFAADTAATAAYAAARGFSTDAELPDTYRQSLFLSGAGTDITPLLRGTMHGCDFTWFQTAGDVYAVQLGKTFPHVFVRSRLNPDNRGLSAGHIGDVTPITLEADFGRYFTAYASGAEAQIDVRELLTPDVMLAMLLSALTADFEFLDGVLFVSFPQAAASDAAAYAEITSLEPIISQLLEGDAFSLNPLSQKFRPPRFHVDLGHLADRTTFASLKLIGLFFLAIILGSAANNLPKAGPDVSLALILVGIVLFVLCAVLTVGLVYAAVLYATFDVLRELFVRVRVWQLGRSYSIAYVRVIPESGYRRIS